LEDLGEAPCPGTPGPLVAAARVDTVLVGVDGVDGEWPGQCWRRRRSAWESMASPSGVSLQAAGSIASVVRGARSRQTAAMRTRHPCPTPIDGPRSLASAFHLR
jgi:hypothetical protein